MNRFFIALAATAALVVGVSEVTVADGPNAYEQVTGTQCEVSVTSPTGCAFLSLPLGF